jgi:Holliday junction resolvase-like predicted endonuclease
MDIGESLVGAYMRYIRGCEVVVYNTFLRSQQGEIDVVALKTGKPRTVWICEVTTHIGGMLYPGAGGTDGTVEKLRAKVLRARNFAAVTFPTDHLRFEVWSPRVSRGKLTTAFEKLKEEAAGLEMDLAFVMNDDYTDRIRELAEHARHNTSPTSEPAYRMLQVMTHLRGGQFSL